MALLCSEVEKEEEWDSFPSHHGIQCWGLPIPNCPLVSLIQRNLPFPRQSTLCFNSQHIHPEE